MDKNRILGIIAGLLLVCASGSLAASSNEISSTRDPKGEITSRAFDSHPDGKADRWIYYKKGKVVRQEWDRNFDGKPDLRIVTDGKRLKYKQYDYNFDGKFDTLARAPARGDTP